MSNPNISAQPESTTGAARNFTLYLCFRFFISFAAQMQAVVVAWQLYAATGSPLTLGLIGLAEVIPYVGTSLFGGHVADLIDRRRIILCCAAVFTACSGVLLAITIFAYPHLPHVEVLFYIVIFTTGIARGFMSPALSGLFAQILPRRSYLRASAWNSNLWHIAAVAGPAAGGLAYGALGVLPAYGIVLGLSCLAMLFMWMLPSFPLNFEILKEPMVRSISKGLSFVFSNQIILGAMALDLVAVLFGGAVAVLPVFASDVLNTGPAGLGYLRAAPFLGSLVMGLYLAFYRPMRHAGMNLLLTVAGFGLSMILFALSRDFLLSFALLFFSGVFDSVSVVIRSTILQLMMPDHMRGRVSAVNNIFIGTSNELGAFESGLAAKLLGLVPSVVIGGTISIVTVVATAFAAPKLRKLDLGQLVEKDPA